MKKWILLVIVTLGFLLRIAVIDRFPVGFTPDEASFGYDAYSILKTGKDQWGTPFPLSLRSFGDFKLPLYAYLTVPSVAVFGLNEFAVRLPSAIVGALAVLATYLMVFELTRNKNLALVSGLFLAISPWHLPLSRGAFEANLTTFFLPFGIYAFLKGTKDPKWLWVSALAFGLNLFSYHSARLVTPLIVLFLLWWKGKSIERNRGTWGAALVFLVFMSLAFYQLMGGGLARSSDIGIFNPTDKWESLYKERHNAVILGLPDALAKLYWNKPVYIARNFIGNYVSYFSPQFLFTSGAGEWTYGMIPGMGVLYLTEAVFLGALLWQVIKGGNRQETGLPFLVLWVLVSPIPAALTKGSGYAGNRLAVMMPALEVLSAFGLMYLYQSLSVTRKKLFVYGVSGITAVLFLTFLVNYFYLAPVNAASSMLYGRKEAVDFAKGNEGSYREIIFSRSLSEPQIYVAFFGKWDPGDYQKESLDWRRYEAEGRSFVDQLGYFRLGKYIFSDLNYSPKGKGGETLYIGKPNEFPWDTPPAHTVYYPDGTPDIYEVIGK